MLRWEWNVDDSSTILRRVAADWHSGVEMCPQQLKVFSTAVCSMSHIVHRWLGKKPPILPSWLSNHTLCPTVSVFQWSHRSHSSLFAVVEAWVVFHILLWCYSAYDSICVLKKCTSQAAGDNVSFVHIILSSGDQGILIPAPTKAIMRVNLKRLISKNIHGSTAWTPPQNHQLQRRSDMNMSAGCELQGSSGKFDSPLIRHEHSENMIYEIFWGVSKIFTICYFCCVLQIFGSLWMYDLRMWVIHH